MSCVSSSNLSHWLTWRPCRKAGGGGWVCTEKVCVVAQLHEWGKLRRYRLTRKKKRVEGVMGRGESGREFRQSQLSSNWVEWLRGIGRSWVFCVRAAETVERSELKSPLFFFSRESVFTAIQIQPPLSNHCPPFLSPPLYLPTFIYLSLHLSICLCPIDHQLGDKAQQPVKAESFELLFQTKREEEEAVGRGEVKGRVGPWWPCWHPETPSWVSVISNGFSSHSSLQMQNIPRYQRTVL